MMFNGDLFRTVVRLRGNDGMGIVILICFGKQVSDGLLPYLLGFRFRQFLRRFLNHVRREFVQAVGVSQRAFAFEAGRAFEVQADDFGFLAQGRGVVGAGRAVGGDEFAVECGGEVHQTAVVADDGVGAGEQVNRFGKVGFAAKVDAEAV